jgi:hypothetical protein
MRNEAPVSRCEVRALGAGREAGAGAGGFEAERCTQLSENDTATVAYREPDADRRCARY